MPVFYSEENTDCQVAIWKMEEDVDELIKLAGLSSSDLHKVNSFTHAARKKEWISIRLLMKILKRNFSIGYLESGKPFLENSSFHISISHTRDYAGIILSEKFIVGIDLERIHPRIENIAHKFLSAEENAFLPYSNHLETLFVIWGVKEVLFKMHSIGDLIFRENLLVHPFEFRNHDWVEATVAKDLFHRKYKLEYRLVGDLLLTKCIDRS